MRTKYFLIILILSLFIYDCKAQTTGKKNSPVNKNLYSTAKMFINNKPYTRWWWFASVIKKEDIKDQLDWVKKNNFGGVEIAFIYPVKRDPKAIRDPWLGKEWQGAVEYAKLYADSIGLGCDFTFGTLWPFGGTFVKDNDRTLIWGDPSFKQLLELSWTHPVAGNVLNHMDKNAFERYANVMGNALLPALKGSTSSIFCDSWEVETKRIWTSGFDSLFYRRFGYDIKPYMDSIYTKSNTGHLYDYMKLVSEKVINNLYIPFTNKAHQLGALSRVQCNGSPTDIISAYASADIPETEAMLYNPNYSKIVSSAAALSNKRVVSSETFTCLYGFPAKYFKKEQTADLKLVADALFANGVNQILWHGMPYNPKGVDSITFYATVHVGKNSNFIDELPSFNNYLTKVSSQMKWGKTYSGIAAYLPIEDGWIAGEYPKELQLPWCWGAYEMRYVDFNQELEGYHPLWINNDFLHKGKLKNDVLWVNDLPFYMLYIDSKFLDIESLKTILNLAKHGFPVCLKQTPEQAGFIKDDKFRILLSELTALKNVKREFNLITKNKPLVAGENIPGFWCRINGNSAKIFFANPRSKKLTYPVSYGQSFQDKVISRKIIINFKNKSYPVTLNFEPYQSIMITINEKGKLTFDDIKFIPKIPEQKQ